MLKLFAAALAMAGQTGVPAPAPSLPTAPAAPAPVGPSPAERDARCLDAFLYGASGSGVAAQAQNRLGVLFFYGRLLGRDAALDVSAAMRAAAPAIAADLPAETQRCQAELRAAGAALGAAGQSLGGR